MRPRSTRLQARALGVRVRCLLVSRPTALARCAVHARPWPRAHRSLARSSNTRGLELAAVRKRDLALLK